MQLIYGGGSVKRNGIYDAVVKILRVNGAFIPDGGNKVLTREEVLRVLEASL